MNIITIISLMGRAKLHTAGFSLVETLIIVSSLAVLALLAVANVGKVRAAAKTSKLHSDVATLNSATRAYLGVGGQFSSAETIDTVILKLKLAGSRVNRKTIPGVSGNMVDPRLKCKIQTGAEAATSEERVFWNSSKSRFEIAKSGGPGVSEFYLGDGTLNPNGNLGLEDRDLAFNYSANPGWIWDYDESSTSASLAISPTTVAMGNSTPPGYTGIPISLNIEEASVTTPNVLLPPSFSIPGGNYDSTEFPLGLELSNPNPSGTSRIVYSIDYGPWNTYTEPVDVNDTSKVLVKAVSEDSLNWGDSVITDQQYTKDWVALNPPEISASSPSFSEEVETIAVALNDVNTPGFSSLQYRLDGETWVDYQGQFALIRDHYSEGLSMEAKAIPTNSAYIESSVVIQGIDNIKNPISPETVTLSFADTGVDFAGISDHFFTDIDGEGASMGLMVSDNSTFSDGYESSSVTGNGDTGAFWLTSGLGAGSTTFTMDFSANPASLVDFMIYHINVSGGGDKVTVTAVTDSGTLLSNPVITGVENADYNISGNTLDAFTFDEDIGEANAHVTFDPPGNEKITHVHVKWEESSHGWGGYHGVGLGEVTFTFEPDS